MCKGQVLKHPLIEDEHSKGPKNSDQCQIYHIHQDGKECHQHAVKWADIMRNTRSTKAPREPEICPLHRLTLIHVPEALNSNAIKPVAPVDPFDPVKRASDGSEYMRWTTPALPKMPRFFSKHLQEICRHCECKQDILWKNLFRPEHHFDACFRYRNDDYNLQNRCFLKLYSLRVPSLTEPMLTLSMVHHIRVEGDKFVPENNPEKSFAILSGRNPQKVKFHIIDYMIKGLFSDLIPKWEDISQDHSVRDTGISQDHSVRDAGITPRLFIAALLSQYGSTISANVEKTAELLLAFDATLSEGVLAIQGGKSKKNTSEATRAIQDANKKLVTMTHKLTGIKSTMHYLAESAQVLVKDIVPFHEYIRARLDDWMVPKALSHQTRLDDWLIRDKQHPSETAPPSQWINNPNSGKLKQGLKQLDIVKEHLRDQDKLIMVTKNMFQYKQDIKGLQQHIDLNIGMVRNVIAERDRYIQQKLMKNSDEDGHKTLIMAILTAALLPGTFMAILLTTPIFNWTDPTKPVVVHLPTKIYWGVTLPLSFLFLFGLYLSIPSKWVYNLIYGRGWVILKDTEDFKEHESCEYGQVSNSSLSGVGATRTDEKRRAGFRFDGSDIV